MAATSTAAPRPPGGLRPAVAWGYAAFVVAIVALLAATGDASLFLVGPASALVAMEVGLRRNRPARSWPWRFLQAAFVLSAASAAVREATTVAPSLQSVPADVLGVLVYALIGVWLVALLRSGGGGAREGALTDGLLVGVGAVLVVWVFLVAPTLAIIGVPLFFRLTASLFPVLDAVVLFLVLRLAFATASRVTALLLMLGSLGATLVGDLAWGLATAGLAVPAGLSNASYLLAVGLAGAAVLHPSMRVLTDGATTVVTPLSSWRLLTVTVAFVAPAALLLARPAAQLLDRVVLAAGILALAVMAHVRTVRAVRQHLASELRLLHLATHDTLTGLPNRLGLAERVGEALRVADLEGGRTVGILFIDLDGFKLINDSWGHVVGDELLVAVGRRLQTVTREADVVARMGGDEFVIVAPTSDPTDELPALVRRVLGLFDDPFVIGIGEVFVGASIGVTHAGLADGRPEAEDLIRDADVAMYQAKSEGRNRWALFEPAMREEVTRRVEISRAVRGALERDELVVHYQPVVRLADGAPVGLEALVRWDRPGSGLVPPLEFIPVIEDTDLILPVGALVLRRSVNQLVRWRSRFPDAELHVAVNVAARQLRDPGFLGLIRSVLRESGLPASALILEITESVMVEDSHAILARLTALRALGVQLSVDDFGTGYSSLRYLKRFPVNQVKIDRAFVAGLGADPDDEAIVAAVLAMAHALGLEVVAEGVETERQRDRLRALGCDAAQGYLFSRPLPADGVPSLLTGVSSSVST